MIRTESELVDKIAEDLVWRKRELTDLRALIQKENNEIRTKVLIRAAIALLYAHWEGFVKKISTYYLEYVASHRLPYRKLSSNFIGLTLRKKFVDLGANEKLSAANDIADFFCTKMDNRSNIPYQKGVDTKANLTSKVLLDIIEALGLDKSIFSTRLHFIDSKLVERRNHIAHGESLEINVEEYLDLHDEVIGLIEAYRNEIENSSNQKKYELQSV